MRLLILRFVLLTAVLIPIGATAGSIAGTGGSTEFTQLMNNGELLTLNGQQAAAVAEAIKQTMIEREQYSVMRQNTDQLDPGLATAGLVPYQGQTADLQKLLANVNAIAGLSKKLSGALKGNAQDMVAMGMTGAQYLNWMMAQSKSKQTTYANQLQDELDSMGAFQQRYETLQQLQQDIPGIDGQVKGLQTLTKTMGMATGELMDLRLLVQQQQTAMTQQRMLDAGSAAANDQRGAQDAQSYSDSVRKIGEAFKGRPWK